MSRSPFYPSVGQRGFTLVELLVVIGIIALLISILLPTLNRAREAANSVTCLSNQRQIAVAAIMMNEERGVIPTLSDEEFVRQVDSSGSKWPFRDLRPGETDDYGDGKKLKDPMSSLLPYLGDDSDTSFYESKNFSKVFLCPSDTVEPNFDDATFPPPSGYFLPQGTNNRAVPVSYGFNADVASTITNKRSYIGKGWLGVINGPSGDYSGETEVGLSANCKLVKVRDASKTLLLGDCGTLRTQNELANGSYQDKPNMLAYMSNYMHYNGGDKMYHGTLAGMMQTGWLAWKVPLMRHGDNAVNADWQNPAKAEKGKVNLTFVDGHAASVSFKDRDNPQAFAEVKITPYDLPEVP